MQEQIGIVIPCFQAARHLPSCLPPLLNSSLKPRILIIDSSSSDGTAAIAEEMGVEVMIIPQNEFNHGTTREKGRKHLNTPIVVMMTQDAYAASPDMLQHLIDPLVQKQASLSYARQLPHRHAGFFGSFHRKFNYPPNSQIRSLSDIRTYGSYTFFCSNSCAAYLNSALDEIGGFSPVPFGEDSIAAAKLIQRGHRISYSADAEVFHSHDYGLKEEFIRHLSIGASRQEHHLLCSPGSDSARGRAYVKALFGELLWKAPHLIPYAFIHTAAKFCGYHLGRWKIKKSKILTRH